MRASGARLLAPFLLAGALLAQGKLGGIDGAEAPLHTWHVAGGCAARTGVTRTGAVRGELTEAWSVDFGLPIEEEPLVWGDVVLVVTSNGEDRTIHFLRLRDGREWITSRTYTSSVPLRPSLWNRLLALRASANEVHLLRMDHVGVQTIHRHSSDNGVSGPLLYGRELYLRDGGDVVRVRIGSTNPHWRAESQFRGELALRDQEVYGLDYTGNGWPELVALGRHDGRSKERWKATSTRHALPGESADGFPVIGESLAFVPRPRAGGMGGPLGPVIAVSLQGWQAGYFPIPAAALPAIWDDRFLMLANDERFGNVLLQAEVPEKADRIATLYLATREYHRDYTQPTVPPSVAGGVAFVGTFGVDLEDLRITWRSDRHGADPDATMRAIPARSTLLLPRGSVLTALRPAGARLAEPPLVLGDPAALASLRGARAFLRDGTMLEGNLGVAHDTGKLTAIVSGRRIEFELEDVLLLQDASGTPLVLAEARDLGEGVGRVVESELAELLGHLARRVVRSNDFELIEEVIAEAQLMGAPESDLRYALNRFDRLKKRSRKPRLNERLAKEQREKWKSLASEAVAAAWEQLRLPEQVPEPTRLAVLRALLEWQPDHEGALDAVRERLPEGIDEDGEFPALDWLDFLDARQQVALDFTAAAAEGSPAQKHLLEQRESWREDLMGIESERLLVMAPPDAPGGVARCVSAGELVCKALESLFAGGEDVREDTDRLRILVFGSKEAYLEHSGGEQKGHLAWTAGHYSPLESVSRMYLPAEDDAFARVMPVFVHELTHHWLEERCPRVSKLVDPRVRSQQPGYWIVEGFASFVEEFRFDLAARSWKTEDPRDENLDILANVNPVAVLDWEFVYQASQVDMHRRLSKQPAVVVTDTWRLGQSRQLSATNMFYVQAAATCHYLFHAGEGEHRQALLDYVGAWYSGKRRDLALDDAVGMSFKELGRKVVAYAKEKVP